MNRFYPLPLMVTIIVSAADRPTANQIAVEISGREADRDSYTNGLSPTGTEPATHYWCSTLANDGMVELMSAEFGRIPSAQFFTSISNPGSEFLLATNVESARPDSLQESGAYTVYTSEMMLEAVGLKRVTASMNFLTEAP